MDRTLVPPLSYYHTSQGARPDQIKQNSRLISQLCMIITFFIIYDYGYNKRIKRRRKIVFMTTIHNIRLPDLYFYSQPLHNCAHSLPVTKWSFENKNQLHICHPKSTDLYKIRPFNLSHYTPSSSRFLFINLTIDFCVFGTTYLSIHLSWRIKNQVLKPNQRVRVTE